MRFLFAAILLLAATANATAQDQQVGARTKAMGGGYTAFEDDPISIWLNPAGIATQPDGMSISYQSYQVYEPKGGSGAAGSGPPNKVPAEMGWTVPALLPSYLGVVMQAGSSESPAAFGFCFSAPFRLKFPYSGTPPYDELDQSIDQTFYRLRLAFAKDFHLKEGEGAFTHVAIGLGLDVSVTDSEFKDFRTGGIGTVNLSDMGFGAGVGLLLGVYNNLQNLKINFGIAWQSKVAYEFSLDSTVVPLNDWPEQYQAGFTFYLLDKLPLRLTLDAQFIKWDAANPDSTVAGRDSFRDSRNFSLGMEYRVGSAGRYTFFPRAGLRLYQAPYQGQDKGDLPATGDSVMFISNRSDEFKVFSLGVGIQWPGEKDKNRMLDLAYDIGNDAPSFAVSYSMEW